MPSLSREIWWRGDRPWGLLSRDPADLRLADTAQSGGRWSHSSALSSFACRSVPRPPQSCCPLSPGLPAPLSAAASALQPRYEGRPAPRGTPGRHVHPGNARVLPPPGSSWTSGPPTPLPRLMSRPTTLCVESLGEGQSRARLPPRVCASCRYRIPSSRSGSKLHYMQLCIALT